ncbi:hypothetical protein BH10PSE17_BH10PSE17_13280 [soil metagenome]
MMRRRDLLRVIPAGLGAAMVGRTGIAASAADPVRKVVGYQHFLALLADGSVVGWGRYLEKQLGEQAAQETRRRYGVAAPVRIELPGRAVDLAAGIYSSAAVLDDGSVWVWGQWQEGQPGTAIPQRLDALQGIVQVTIEGSTAHALSEDGELFSWGSRDGGVLGDGRVPARWGESLPPVRSPIPATLLDGVRLSKLGVHTAGMAIREDGQVLQWPVPRGPEKSTDVWTPLTAQVVEVPLPAAAIDIASTGGARLALLRDGTVWAWGWNLQGLWGIGKRADTNDPDRWRATPQQVPGVTQAVALTSGTAGRHALVLLRDGSLRGWGNTDWGQIGAGVHGTDQSRAVTPRISGVVRVWAAGNNSFALTRDGRFWSWGGTQDGAGLLGTQSNVPVAWPASLLQPA